MTWERHKNVSALDQNGTWQTKRKHWTRKYWTTALLWQRNRGEMELLDWLAHLPEDLVIRHQKPPHGALWVDRKPRFVVDESGSRAQGVRLGRGLRHKWFGYKDDTDWWVITRSTRCTRTGPSLINTDEWSCHHSNSTGQTRDHGLVLRSPISLIPD